MALAATPYTCKSYARPCSASAASTPPSPLMTHSARFHNTLRNLFAPFPAFPLTQQSQRPAKLALSVALTVALNR